MNIPNQLTVARFVLTVVFLAVLFSGIPYHHSLSLILFGIASLTDYFDGKIARRDNLITDFGKLMDPLADKILIVSTYVMLVLAGDLPFWLILLIGFRDLGIIAGVLVLNTLNGHVQMQPSLLSKVNTFLQISLVILVMVERIGFIALEPVAEILLWFVAATTVASAIHYVYFWFIHPLESRVEQKVESKD